MLRILSDFTRRASVGVRAGGEEEAGEEEEEDERVITSAERYVLIPPELRHPHKNLEARIESWLSDVSVEPL